MIRVSSQPAYRGGARNPAEAIDDIAANEGGASPELRSGGRLVTFDAHVAWQAVKRGSRHLTEVPAL